MGQIVHCLLLKKKIVSIYNITDPKSNFKPKYAVFSKRKMSPPPLRPSEAPYLEGLRDVQAIGLLAPLGGRNVWECIYHFSPLPWTPLLP